MNGSMAPTSCSESTASSAAATPSTAMATVGDQAGPAWPSGSWPPSTSSGCRNRIRAGSRSRAPAARWRRGRSPRPDGRWDRTSVDSANTAGTNSPMTASTSIVASMPAILRREPLVPVAQAAEQQAGAQHQQQVADDRPGERRLDHLDLARGQREERDDELRDVAERRVEDAADLGPGEPAQALRGDAHDIGETQDAGGADHEDGRAVDVAAPTP